MKAPANCVKSGQCYMGKDPETECCGGHAVTDLACEGQAVCAMCEAIVPELITALSAGGCEAVVPEGVAMCQIIGFGPGDPLADICSGIVSTSCVAIALLLQSGVINANTICNDIGMCGDNGSTVWGQRCDCVKKGHCTLYEAGCCNGKSDYDWGCAFPLSLCE